MSRTISRARFLAVASLAVLFVGWCAWFAASGEARGELVRHSTPGGFISSYYVPPVGDNSVGARMYPCPRPTPAWVGHTYITYPPLAPHEFLYRHQRTYRTWHDDAPPTRTSVRWR